MQGSASMKSSSPDDDRLGGGRGVADVVLAEQEQHGVGEMLFEALEGEAGISNWPFVGLVDPEGPLRVLKAPAGWGVDLHDQLERHIDHGRVGDALHAGVGGFFAVNDEGVGDACSDAGLAAGSAWREVSAGRVADQRDLVRLDVGAGEEVVDDRPGRLLVVTAEGEAGVVHQRAPLAWAFEDQAVPAVVDGGGSDPAVDLLER